MTTLIAVGFILLLLLLASRSRTTTKRIEDTAPGTILVYTLDGSKSEREYGSGTDEYYHQECAADYLCTPEKHSRIEIKDESGKVYTYTHESLKREGWL